MPLLVCLTQGIFPLTSSSSWIFLLIRLPTWWDTQSEESDYSVFAWTVRWNSLKNTKWWVVALFKIAQDKNWLVCSQRKCYFRYQTAHLKDCHKWWITTLREGVYISNRHLSWMQISRNTWGPLPLFYIVLIIGIPT